MALLKCNECGAEVSSSAPTCPKCGIERLTPRKIGGEIWKVFIAVSILFLAYLFLSVARR